MQKEKKKIKRGLRKIDEMLMKKLNNKKKE